jgi:predicted nucleotidyltransferase component of viral defense system
MTIKLIQRRLESYRCSTQLEEQQALREISQEIVLAALGRHDFFKEAVFQGGTCLRIFFGLNRFSEDMDFILRRPDIDFRLERYLGHVASELSAYGFQVEILDKTRAGSTLQRALLKDDSLSRLLVLQHPDPSGPQAKIRIKLEVDTQPPATCGTSLRYLDFPFVSGVVTQDFPGLFAGKVHAVLCRQYVKGRDWYDFLWYMGQGIGLDFGFLQAAINQTGPWQGLEAEVNREWVVASLTEKIEGLDWPEAVADVRRFLRPMDEASLDHWGPELFLTLLKRIG